MHGGGGGGGGGGGFGHGGGHGGHGGGGFGHSSGYSHSGGHHGGEHNASVNHQQNAHAHPGQGGHNTFNPFSIFGDSNSALTSLFSSITHSLSPVHHGGHGGQGTGQHAQDALTTGISLQADKSGGETTISHWLKQADMRPGIYLVSLLAGLTGWLVLIYLISHSEHKSPEQWSQQIGSPPGQSAEATDKAALPSSAVSRAIAPFPSAFGAPRNDGGSNDSNGTFINVSPTPPVSDTPVQAAMQASNLTTNLGAYNTQPISNLASNSNPTPMNTRTAASSRTNKQLLPPPPANVYQSQGKSNHYLVPPPPPIAVSGTPDFSTPPGAMPYLQMGGSTSGSAYAAGDADSSSNRGRHKVIATR